MRSCNGKQTSYTPIWSVTSALQVECLLGTKQDHKVPSACEQAGAPRTAVQHMYFNMQAEHLRGRKVLNMAALERYLIPFIMRKRTCGLWTSASAK